MGSGLKLAINKTNVLLQRLAQFGGDFWRGFAVAFADFMLKLGNGCLHDAGRFFAQVFQHRRVDLGFDGSAL